MRQQMPREMPQTRKPGCWTYAAIGCAGVLLLSAIGGFFAYRGVKGFITEMAEEYTDTAPLELPGVEVSEHEAAAVLGRVAAFNTALEQDRQPATLKLTARDINILIHKHPDWTNMADKIYVTIEEDKVRGQTSIPLNEFGGMFEGRYLNGAAALRVDMLGGRLLVFVDSIDVGGKALPEQFMEGLRAKNLADDANMDPETMAVFQELDSITVKNGSVVIVPRTR